MKSTYKESVSGFLLMPARLNTSHTFLTRWGIHSLKLCMFCAIPEISTASVCVKGQCVRGKRGKPMLRGQNILVLKGLLGWAGYMFYQHFAKQQITPVQHACHNREIRKCSKAKKPQQQSIYNRKKWDWLRCHGENRNWLQGPFLLLGYVVHTVYVAFKKKNPELKFIQLDRISPVINLSMAMLYLIEFHFQFSLQTQ